GPQRKMQRRNVEEKRESAGKLWDRAHRFGQRLSGAGPMSVCFIIGRTIRASGQMIGFAAIF
ncbi:hypothetical protein, partial [Roseibium sp. RKSG952]|uniref:hypothetical protein n=1 Tax=Roseibium sp. RKSG952 TaxID=2529384 RepID=UPI001AD90113